MNKNPLYFVLFLAGLAVVCWIGAGYVHSNALGVAVTLVIAACYVVGGLELRRYRQATASLVQTLADVSSVASGLTQWLGRLHPSLRNAVRLRIEGERVALPAPALTSYLVGLLVLLGMLGTLLGMMATLRGTGMALETATDLDAIRGSLASPVKGLGFAFGTSIAGVATSAVLGLLSALCRRERMNVMQDLDAAIATDLRVHSQAWQREESFRLIQQQNSMMPALVDRLQGMIAAIEQQNASSHERLLADQHAFHVRTEAATAQLAASLDQSLKAGIDESARAFGIALRPAMESTLAGLAQQASATQATITQAVQQQLDGISSGLASTAQATAGSWNLALDEQKQTNEALSNQLKTVLDDVTRTFEQRTATLFDTVSVQLEKQQIQTADTWKQMLGQQQEGHASLAERNEQALTAAAAGFEQQAAALVRSVDDSHAQLQQRLASQDEARLTGWRTEITAMSTALRQDWADAGMQNTQRQNEICEALARSAHDITTHAQAHASETIAEISKLVQAASEAPHAAAEVISQMRQQLSDSMVRDTAMLEERNQLMSTLQTLLDAVNHASTEQRGAIDALVATSADLLDRVGTRFTDHIESETGKLGTIAAQVAVGATEVGGLAEAFGASVQLYGTTNEQLLQQLHSIEQALERSLTRSDEQLAYYVAQAREVIDLSMLAQQQILTGLHGDARANGGATNA